MVFAWFNALWFGPPVLLALIALRFYRSRRREVLAGSLLLWRRLAAEQPHARPRRIVIDRSLILQALALVALVAALAGPLLALGGRSGRGLVLVVDNGTLARAHGPDGTPLFSLVRSEVESVCGRLAPEDRVFLVAAAPLPALIEPDGLSPADAARRAAELSPAVSGPATADLLGFAADQARSLCFSPPLKGGDTEGVVKDSPLQFLVVSLQERPAAALERNWLCIAPQGVSLKNVGIAGFGATPITVSARPQVQVLARVKNFSTQAVRGCVTVTPAAENAFAPEEKPLALERGAEDAVVFTLPREAGPIRLTWKAETADALAEDDTVVAAPRRVAPPRVRFHGAAPALKKLYEQALQAQIVPAEEAADLDLYVRSIPERVPDNSRAVMLLAPENGYRVFDVGADVLKRPLPLRDEDDRLTAGMGASPEGAFFVQNAREILPGNFRSLIKDSRSGRTLVASFPDEKERLGFVLAFIPGADLPPEGFLEPPLAAMLVRMALQAAGSGEPYTVARAADIEKRSRLPLAYDWPDAAQTRADGCGTLDERISALALGQASTHAFDPAALTPLERSAPLDLAPWLIVLALALVALELWLERRSG